MVAPPLPLAATLGARLPSGMATGETTLKLPSPLGVALASASMETVLALSPSLPMLLYIAGIPANGHRQSAGAAAHRPGCVVEDIPVSARVRVGDAEVDAGEFTRPGVVDGNDLRQVVLALGADQQLVALGDAAGAFALGCDSWRSGIVGLPAGMVVEITSSWQLPQAALDGELVPVVALVGKLHLG